MTSGQQISSPIIQPLVDFMQIRLYCLFADLYLYYHHQGLEED